MKKDKLKLSPNIFLLGIVSFLNDLSSEMIMPILPMFINSLGGGGLAIGLIGGVREAIASFLKIISGYFSDRTGRRKVFVVFGYLVSSLFKLFLAASKIWQHILIFMGLERVGKGLRTAPRDAIIAESMPEAQGKGFGIHRSLDTLGAVIGGGVVFILFWFFRLEFRSIILIASFIALVSLIPLMFVKEIKKKPEKISLKISLKVIPKPLKLFIIISCIFSLANFSYMFFILRAKGIFEGKYAVGLPILLYMIFNIFYAGLSTPLGIISDRVGRKIVIGFGYLLFSLVCLGFYFFSSFISFIILFSLYGVVYGAVDGNQRAFVSDLSSPRLKATALGSFHTLIGFAALLGSLIAGFLWQNFSYKVTFLYGSILSIVSVILLTIFRNYFNGGERKGFIPMHA